MAAMIGKFSFVCFVGGKSHYISAGNGSPLDIKSLWKLMNELHDVRTKWRLIGLGLQILPTDLDAMNGGPQECLEKALTKWLNGSE